MANGFWWQLWANPLKWGWDKTTCASVLVKISSPTLFCDYSWKVKSWAPWLSTIKTTTPFSNQAHLLPPLWLESPGFHPCHPGGQSSPGNSWSWKAASSTNKRSARRMTNSSTVVTAMSCDEQILGQLHWLHDRYMFKKAYYCERNPCPYAVCPCNSKRSTAFFMAWYLVCKPRCPLATHCCQQLLGHNPQHNNDQKVHCFHQS